MKKVKSFKDKMKCCYAYLECDENASMQKLRENFLYKMQLGQSQLYGLDKYFYMFYDTVAEDDLCYRETRESEKNVERQFIIRDLQFLHSSYLAILLNRENKNSQTLLLDVLTHLWEKYAYYFQTDEIPLRFPLEDEEPKLVDNGYITKEEYIKILESIELDYRVYGTRLGDYFPFLRIIINYEKEKMEEQVIKNYGREYVMLGRAIEKDEHAKRLKIIKRKFPKEFE